TYTMNLQTMKPAAIRELLRKGLHKNETTAFWAEGYKQANLAVMPSAYAADFKKFAHGNEGSLPVLYTLAKWAKLRLVISANIVKSQLTCPLTNKHHRTCIYTLPNSEYDWSDMVTFYIGCSFSFNKIMLENSLLTPSAKCVSMYKTNIECYPSGPFKCKTIVSMRAMHKDKLSQIHQITSPLKDVHGAPIHYGNPSAIGIPNLKDCFAGKTTDFDADEIPVFWACGMTAFEAISTAGLELAFTHGPGSVFLTDVLQENIKEAKDPKELCEVIEYSPGMYSALSKHAVDKLEALDKIVQCDLGKRGIDQLIVEGDFIKAALALSHANKVAIVTGAPVHQTHEQPDETDGLPGVISLAAALQSLDKTIDVLADSYSFTVIQKIISKCVKTGLLKSPVTVIQAQDLSM
uniref:D-glutamate cyclase-like C-terminal domain-containing protein n=1 Tax=Ciona intestinalis TaxID=7719 RepID=F6QFQ6_CIOIN